MINEKDAVATVGSDDKRGEMVGDGRMVGRSIYRIDG